MDFFGLAWPKWPQLLAHRRNKICNSRVEYVAKRRLFSALFEWHRL